MYDGQLERDKLTPPGAVTCPPNVIYASSEPAIFSLDEELEIELKIRSQIAPVSSARRVVRNIKRERKN